MDNEACTLVFLLETMETVCDSACNEGSPWCVFVLLLECLIELKAHLHSQETSEKLYYL